MSTRHIYPGINNYKLLAALLVITIHTSPLVSLSKEADFILTRILARTAVPFFFLVTGYFVLPKALKNSKRAIAYGKRIGVIYLVSLLLYLPVGIYAGHFQDLTVTGLLKMIFLDGTFYHLWYLPALLLGFVLMLLLLRTLPLYATGILTALLYTVGLFGDSYYGFILENSLMHNFYELLFQIFEYTRNGLFYAPVFLFLGYLLASRKRPRFSLSLFGIGFSSALILAEGITLHLLDVQRHDSMYISLLPLMYFLFSALLDSRMPDFTKQLPKDLPLLIYLLHPLFIILVRGAAKVTGLQILADNSLLHFLAVAISTLGCAWMIPIVLDLLRSQLTQKNPRSVR